MPFASPIISRKRELFAVDPSPFLLCLAKNRAYRFGYQSRRSPFCNARHIGSPFTF